MALAARGSCAVGSAGSSALAREAVADGARESSRGDADGAARGHHAAQDVDGRHEARCRVEAGSELRRLRDMSGAERAEKKRRRAGLFPAKAAAQREKDVERKQAAAARAWAQEAAAAAAEAQEAAAAALEYTYLDIASYADELDGTTAAGATAGEWRERAANVRAEKLTLEQADAAQEAADEAWMTARDKVAEERKAADRRGEGWWRDLWSSEGMCEAWQGPLPPYMSTVCACCRHEPVMGGRDYDGT